MTTVDHCTGRCKWVAASENRVFKFDNIERKLGFDVGNCRDIFLSLAQLDGFLNERSFYLWLNSADGSIEEFLVRRVGNMNDCAGLDIHG